MTINYHTVIFEESTTDEDWKYRLVYHDGFYRECQSARDEIHSHLKLLLEDLAKEQNCNIDELKLYTIGFSVSGAGFSIFEYTSMNLFTVIQFTLYFVAIEFILLLFL